MRNFRSRTATACQNYLSKAIMSKRHVAVVCGLYAAPALGGCDAIQNNDGARRVLVLWVWKRHSDVVRGHVL